MKIIPLDTSDRETLARLKQMPVFDALDNERLSQVLTLAELRRYDANETIIRQGDEDQTIYFLIMGSCSVQVEGLDINTISQTGTMFGEMGVIDQTPRSATVAAIKPVLCLAMPPDFMERLEGVDKLAAQALFYRIFSEKLSSRLRAANARILELESRMEFNPA